jgi:hypothetical protein
MTGDERLVRDIVREHCLTDAVWTDKHDVRRLGNELEVQDCFDCSAIASRRPTPIELVDRFESPEACAFHPSFKTSADMFLFFPLQ